MNKAKAEAEAKALEEVTAQAQQQSSQQNNYSSGSNYSDNNSGGSSSSISSSNNSGGKYVIRQLDRYDAAGNYIGSLIGIAMVLVIYPYAAGMGGF